MLTTGGTSSVKCSSFEQEIHAVRAELAESVNVVHLHVGIRPGINDSKGAVEGFFRSDAEAGVATASEGTDRGRPADERAVRLTSWPPRGPPLTAIGGECRKPCVPEGNGPSSLPRAATSLGLVTGAPEPSADVGPVLDPAVLPDGSRPQPAPVAANAALPTNAPAPPAAQANTVVDLGMGIRVTQHRQQGDADTVHADAAASPPQQQAANPVLALQPPSAVAAGAVSPDGEARPARDPPPLPAAAGQKRQRTLAADTLSRPHSLQDALYGGPVPLWYTRAPGPAPEHLTAAAGACPPGAVAALGGCVPSKRPRLDAAPAGAAALGAVGTASADVAMADAAAAGGLHGSADGRARGANAGDGAAAGADVMLRAANAPAGADTGAGGGAGGSCRACDPSTMPRPKEPPLEAAPYGELLYSARRMGYDLCRRAQDPGSGAAAGSWHATWVKVLLRLRTQLRRRLHTRSTVSKYDTGMCPRSQPLCNHAQLRAAVELLLLLAGELPQLPGPRPRVAPEALDAVEHLLCFSPFVDFEGSDPQARAVLVDGALQLARLAGARARADPAWWMVRDLAAERLAGWLLLQRATLREVAAAAGLGGGVAADRGVFGGLRWGAGTLPDQQRQQAVHAVQRGHEELLRSMIGSLTLLVRVLGSPLARRLLNQDTVDALLEPPAHPTQGPTQASCRAEALVLLHAALLALAPPHAADAASGGAAAGGAASVTCAAAAAAVWEAALTEMFQAAVQSGLRGAAEQALRQEARQPDALLAGSPGGAESPAGLCCRDAAMPLLGTLYALLHSRGVLHSWAAVEGAACQAVWEGGFAVQQHNPWRRAWEAAGADRRSRRLALQLLAHVVRGLASLGQTGLLSCALRSEAPAQRPPSAGQLGLLGAWLRAALDCGGRDALAAFTAQLLLRCEEARRLFGCCSDAAQGGGIGPAIRDVSGGAATEALAAQAGAALDDDADGTFRAQMAAALVSELVRERRFGDVRGMLCGLELTWAAVWEELPALPVDGTAQMPVLGAAAASGGAAARLPDGVLLIHRAMAAVPLAALEPCGAGALARHPAAVCGGGAVGGGGVYPGWGGRPQLGPTWSELQGSVWALRDVARAAVLDAAALVRWEGAAPAGATDPKAHAAEWGARLRKRSAAGLLPHLLAVLAASADARVDLAADPTNPEEPSVLQRCMALLCLLITDLPRPGEAHAATNQQLRALAVEAVLDLLLEPAPAAAGHDLTAAAAQPTSHPHPQHQPPPPPLKQQENPQLQQQRHGQQEVSAHARGVLDAGARDNLARLLHRCLAGSLRQCVVAGLAARVPTSTQPRYAANALAWLRGLMAHPAMRQRSLLERLLPPLLHTLVEGMAAARERLLATDVLKYDHEKPPAAEPGPSQPSPQQPSTLTQAAPPQERLQAGLIGELLATGAAVMRAAAGAGLLAEQEEAYAAPLGAVRIDASPLLLMEPAPLPQLRAAAGFTAGLLARTCLECFALPLSPPAQRVLLGAQPPPEAERCLAVSRRLQSSFGSPPALAQGETPGATRRVCGEDVRKLSAVQAAAGGADALLKLSEAAIGTCVELAKECGSAGHDWSQRAIGSVIALLKQKQELAFSPTPGQFAAIKVLLRRDAAPGQQQGTAGPGGQQAQRGPQAARHGSGTQVQGPAQARAGAGASAGARPPGPAAGGSTAPPGAVGQQPAAAQAGRSAAAAAGRGVVAASGAPPPTVQAHREVVPVEGRVPHAEAHVADRRAQAMGMPAGRPAAKPQGQAAAAPDAGPQGQLERGGRDPSRPRQPPGHEQQLPRAPQPQPQQVPQRQPSPAQVGPSRAQPGNEARRASTGQATSAQPIGVGAPRQAAPSGVADPPGHPKVHFTSLDRLLRADDHRKYLSGCRPFADLSAWLARRAASPPPQPGHQQQQQQPRESQGPQGSQSLQGSQRRASQAEAGGGGGSSLRLPPLVGQVHLSRFNQLPSGPCLQVVLRDASVTATHPVAVFIFGGNDALQALHAELSSKGVIAGVYGARTLADASQASGHNQSAAAKICWPLKCRLHLSGPHPCGVVVEPRTAYAVQLRRDVRALEQRAAAPTVQAGGTPATLPAGAGAGAQRRRASDVGPSQLTEAAGGAGPAAAPAALPPAGAAPAGPRCASGQGGRMADDPARRAAPTAPPRGAAASAAAGPVAVQAAHMVQDIAAAPVQGPSDAQRHNLHAGAEPVNGAAPRGGGCGTRTATTSNRPVSEAGGEVAASAWRGILANTAPRTSLDNVVAGAAADDSAGPRAAGPSAPCEEPAPSAGRLPAGIGGAGPTHMQGTLADIAPGPFGGASVEIVPATQLDDDGYAGSGWLDSFRS